MVTYFTTEDIVLDFNSLPIDRTVGALERDIRLTELLYEDDWLTLDNSTLPYLLQEQAK